MRKKDENQSLSGLRGCLFKNDFETRTFGSKSHNVCSLELPVAIKHRETYYCQCSFQQYFNGTVIPLGFNITLAMPTNLGI